MCLLSDSAFLQHVNDAGGIGNVGFLMLMFSIVLGLIWMSCALGLRRRFVKFGCVVVILAVCGYVFSDWSQISLNLRMRNVQDLRKDCIILMERRESMVEHPWMRLKLSSSDLPLSIARLGAIRAEIDSNCVIVYFTDPSDRWNDYCLAYFPTGRPAPHNFRSTWYRNFYGFKPHYEF